MRLLVFGLRAGLAGPFRFSLVPLAHSSLDGRRRLGVGFLVLVQRVALAAAQTRLPDTGSHGLDRIGDLFAKIQKVSSVIAVLLHPTTDIPG